MANKAQQRQYPQAPTTVTATTTTTTDTPLHTFCAFATTWASSGSGSRYGYGWGSWQVRLRLRVCPHYQVNYMCVCVSVCARERETCVSVCVRVTKGNYNYASIVGAASVGCQWCFPLLFPSPLLPPSPPPPPPLLPYDTLATSLPLAAHRVLHLRLIVINSQGDCPNDVVWSIYGDEYLRQSAHKPRLRAAH